MKQRIKYISLYSRNIKGRPRASNIAAMNKIDYVIKSINRAGYEVDLISPSWIIDDEEVLGWEGSKAEKLFGDNKIIYAPSFVSKIKIFKVIKYLLSVLWLMNFLIFKTSKKEVIFVYHTPYLALPIRIAKRIKQFKLVLEIEEIYSEVWEISRFLKKEEYKIINAADKYILVSDLLKKRFEGKDSIVLYGAYNVIDTKSKNLNKSTVDVVYAGSIDNVKKAAINAVETSRYLNNNYVVHICGYGELKSIEELKKTINNINDQKGRTVCHFHGAKSGTDFTNFLLSCDIAINPQGVGDYMNSAFPSKVLTYLSHDLVVVSTKIDSIINSEVSDLVFFSESDKPQQIAETIKSINLNTKESNVNKIAKLDEIFVASLKEILK